MFENNSQRLVMGQKGFYFEKISFVQLHFGVKVKAGRGVGVRINFAEGDIL